MTKREHKLRLEQRVKLKSDGQDALYAYAGAGSEGWVRQRDHDRLGVPMVFIEWDKDHWTFNGEPDLWTFEDHFIPAEEAMADKSYNLQDQVAEFLEWKKAKEAAEGTVSEPDIDKEYLLQLEAAYETAKTASAFLLIAVEDLPGRVGASYSPKVVNFYKNRDAGLVLESQLSSLAASSHQSLALEEIHRNLGLEDK